MSPRGQARRFAVGTGDRLGVGTTRSPFPLPDRPEGPCRHGVGASPRIGGTHLDPGFEVGDDGGGELPLGGHLRSSSR